MTLKTIIYWLKISVLIIIGLSIFFWNSDIFTLQNSDDNTEYIDYYNNISTQTTYLTETHIFINDSDPIANWNKTQINNEWCSGSGTLNDPYVINAVLLLKGNYSINIEIVNSRVYFQVNNCLFLDCDQGIMLNNVSNGIISNNLISNMASKFIDINNCTNILVHNNLMHDICMEGIIASHSTNISIIENAIDTFCSMNYGIALSYVNFSQVINNSVNFTGGYVKLELYYSNNNIIMNNSLLNTGGSGLILYKSKNNQIMNNTIKDCGDAIIFYSQSCFNEISFNYLAIRGDGIHLSGNSSSNLISDNFIDSSTIFKTDRGDLGIHVYSCNNNTLLSNFITNLGSGISIIFSNYSFIINNTLFHNGYCIREYESVGNLFSNNLCVPIPENYPIIDGFHFIVLIIMIFFGLLVYLRKNLKKVLNILSMDS
jgi:parallel beta-helix repeat protein